MRSALIDAPGLARMIRTAKKGSIRVLDSTWLLDKGRDPLREFSAGPRIPEAIFFDVDAASDQLSPLPHMLPSERDFGTYASSLGLRNTDHVVVYDTAGIFSSPRVWWTFRYFGHDNVSVLNGGLPAWLAAGLPYMTGPPNPPPVRTTPYAATARPELVAALGDIKEFVEGADGSAPFLLDARPHERFTGEAPDPRGLASGHMPGATSVPFANLIDSKGCMLPPAQLAEELARLGADPSDVRARGAAVTTCGSGVTACVVSLALHEAGLSGDEFQRVYDGSWSEWGGTEGCTVRTGPGGADPHGQM